jgi:hypothetical protein
MKDRASFAKLRVERGCSQPCRRAQPQSNPNVLIPDCRPKRAWRPRKSEKYSAHKAMRVSYGHSDGNRSANRSLLMAHRATRAASSRAAATFRSLAAQISHDIKASRADAHGKRIPYEQEHFSHSSNFLVPAKSTLGCPKPSATKGWHIQPCSFLLGLD